MNIADRIQSLRKAKGISQEELADKIGVSRQAVSKWESEQSLPDMEKIIIMSDYFEVTTDYILKGIENEKQEISPVDASIFMRIATALNFIGLILSITIWHERQVAMATAIGLIIMAMGCTVFGIGQSVSTRNVKKANRLFWMINIWFLLFLPLSAIYNLIFSHIPAPYPLFWGYHLNLVLFPAFWLTLIALGLCIVFVQYKRK